MIIGDLHDGEWHHLALVYDHAAQTACVYMDNQQVEWAEDAGGNSLMTWDTSGGLTGIKTEFWTLNQAQEGSDSRGTWSPISIDEYFVYQGLITDFSDGFTGVVAVDHDGDANGDDAVDYLDLGILATNYDQTGMTWAQGDFTADGTVDYLDLGILATEYGWTAPVTGEVPEPMTLSLLAIGGLALIRRKR